MNTTATGDRAVVYVRESVDKYGDARAVDRFEAQCRDLCARRGLRVVAVLRDNDTRASKGNKGAGYARVLRMMRARETDYVVVPVVDRFVRTLRDLEDIIDICEATGVTVLATSGDIDLAHDQGRLVGRILASVAKGEMERKGKRQADANAQAAARGAPRLGTPRPFGWQADRVTTDPDEAAAIRWAADALLGGGTVSGVVHEWNRRGLLTSQGRARFARQSVTTILRNPRLAGLRTYKGEILPGVTGQWEPILTEPQWRAVAALLADPARKPPRGAYSLLGGLARCRCGTTVAASVNHLTRHVYRCNPVLRGDREGPHCQQMIANVDPFVEAVMIERLSRPDIADLVAAPAAGPDPAALRREAASIRANLDEMAADRALGLVTRTQLVAATERGNARLDGIAAELTAAAGTSALAPFAAGGDAKRVWESLDRPRKRAVIDVLTSVIICPAGRGSRTFHPHTVQMPWRQP